MTTSGTREGVPPVYGCVVGDCPVRLWGLTSVERLRRIFARTGVAGLVEPGTVPPGADALCLRADYVYEDRTIEDLARRRDLVLQVEGREGPQPVAVHVPSQHVAAAVRLLQGEIRTPELPGVEVASPETLSTGYTKKLRKLETPVVLKITPDRQAALERHLFDGSYKGVTDAITKWVWPTPARWATRVCARLRLRPNDVTVVSLILVIIATILFARGQFGIGLALAWVMTFLDTVDGKLARVTVQSTQFGHLFDHVIDIVHPPFWYLAWGIGLTLYTAPFPGLSLPVVLAAIVGAYIFGRLIEGAFSRLLSSFSLFCWTLFDSYFRLVMARRNPNLVLLTLSACIGRPDWGLLAVALWTVVSTLILLVRFLTGVWERVTRGPLQSWMTEQPPDGGGIPRLARPFMGYTPARERLSG